MGSLRLTLCTGLLAACALAPGAGHVADGDGAGVSVVPSSPAPGTEVALRATGCPQRTATAASPAFVADTRLSGAEGTLTGDTRVRASVQPGSYDVTLTCADTEIKGSITVVSQAAAHTASRSQGESRPQQRTPAGQPSRSSAAPPAAPASPVAAPASPVAPVDAGGGGAAHFASVDVRGAGPGTGQAITGLVLAGVAAAAVGLLTSRRRRGTD